MPAALCSCSLRFNFLKNSLSARTLLVTTNNLICGTVREHRTTEHKNEAHKMTDRNAEGLKTITKRKKIDKPSR